ncbi:DinB family protein [Seonamhaeicola algicola]|uniref:DinB family protein n=1 Tax=Seonamhaeicola algicola TaxID=1719036 RepID=A0A5C7AYE5_9FLAO|nr:DinB family protein [Seonamhaeicola algicola]TXE13144.1 DinB family protein [Seonamhaeicola algicola]
MQFQFDVLLNVRKALKQILDNASETQLNTIPKGFNNNIIWNIAHLVVSEQLLINKLSGLPVTVSDDLINAFKKGTKPTGNVSQQEIEVIKDLVISSIKKSEENYKTGLFKNYTEYTVSTTGNTLKTVEDALNFVLLHEGIHLGVVMALLKLVK